MPILQSIQPNLKTDGAIVEVRVGYPKRLRELLNKEKVDIPKPLNLSALIDTGASITCISNNVRTSLKLIPRDIQTLYTAGTPHTTNVFDIYIDFLNVFNKPIVFDPIQVVEVPLIGQGNFDCIIGRDILSVMNFNYIGFSNTIILSV